MSKPMLYRPPQRWQIPAALAASVLIHLGAVAASWTEPTVAFGQPDETTVVNLEDPLEAAPEQPQPPPIDMPPPPAEQPIEKSLIPEDATPSPPPVQRQVTTPVLPIRRPPALRLAGPTTMGAAKVAAISAPRPEYPYEARRQRATGAGTVVLNVDLATGNVTSVSMRQSTGNAVLDHAALSAFRRWRFKPGSVSIVQTPITFTMTGAQY